MISADDGRGAEHSSGSGRRSTSPLWMTSMLHLSLGSTDFEVRRQMGDLTAVSGSVAARTYFAECYPGWPTRRRTDHGRSAIEAPRKFPTPGSQRAHSPATVNHEVRPV